jgi:hypothetical protein
MSNLEIDLILSHFGSTDAELHTRFAEQNNMKKGKAILQAFMFLTSPQGLRAFRHWRGIEIARGNL